MKTGSSRDLHGRDVIHPTKEFGYKSSALKVAETKWVKQGTNKALALDFKLNERAIKHHNSSDFNLTIDLGSFVSSHPSEAEKYSYVTCYVEKVNKKPKSNPLAVKMAFAETAVQSVRSLATAGVGELGSAVSFFVSDPNVIGDGAQKIKHFTHSVPMRYVKELFNRNTYRISLEIGMVPSFAQKGFNVQIKRGDSLNNAEIVKLQILTHEMPEKKTENVTLDELKASSLDALREKYVK